MFFLEFTNKWFTNFEIGLNYIFCLGHNATEVLYILNDEEIPLSFYFEENSRFAAGHIASLSVEPMKGTVPPKSK